MVLLQLGFKATAANLLSTPIYLWACLITIVVGFYGDRVGQRAYINIGLFTGGFIGYIILIASRSASLSYAACFLAASGIYPLVPNTVAWVSANTEGSYKRSAVLGLAIGWGNLNGAVTSNVYRAKDKPWYSLGHGIILAYIVIGLISSIIMRLFLKAENDRRARGESSEHILHTESGKPADFVEEGDTQDRNTYHTVEEARKDKGDMWSGFQYTL